MPVRGSLPVDVEVDAANRPELMRDVLDVFAREKVQCLRRAPMPSIVPGLDLHARDRRPGSAPPPADPGPRAGAGVPGARRL